jgi:GT2 family glycosyltransferase
MSGSISVLITSYNHARYIAGTVLSAADQTYPASEIIVVDDASTDGSVEALHGLNHPLLKVIELSRNLGTSAATNRALAAVRGEFVALLGSDDRWHKEKLARQLAVMQKRPEVGVVLTYPALMDSGDKIYAHDAHPHYRYFLNGNKTRLAWLSELFTGNRFCAPSALIRRSCLERVGSFDLALLQLQDYDYWVRVALAGFEFHVIEEPLTYYRFPLSGGNLSASRAPSRRRAFIEHVQILKRFAALSSIEDCRTLFPDQPVPVEAGLIPYSVILALLAHPAPQHRAAGVELLMDEMHDAKWLDLLHARHGVTTAELFALMSHHPLAEFADNQWKQRAKRFLLSRMPPSVETRLRQFLKANL